MNSVGYADLGKCCTKRIPLIIHDKNPDHFLGPAAAVQAATEIPCH